MKNINELIYKTALKEMIEMCKVPRCSNDFFPPKDEKSDNLRQIKKYLLEKAKAYKGTNISTDAVGNVWYDIPATKGCEKIKKVVIQGHMDMVWVTQKEANNWNKKTHPITPIIEKINGREVMHSKDYLTTLGADDSFAIGIGLALLKHQKEFKHGLIRCLFTIDEEVGCNGAIHLGKLKNGKKNNPLDAEQGFNSLLNLDYVNEGDIIASSAGLSVTDFWINKIKSVPATGNLYQLTIDGGLSGHSGIVMDMGRANAIKLVADALKAIGTDIKLSSWSTLHQERGIIQPDSRVKFASSKKLKEIEEILANWLKEVKKHYPKEPNLKYELKQLGIEGRRVIADHRESKLLIDYIDNLWYGPVSHFMDDGFIESSANYGPVRLDLKAKTYQFRIYTFVRAAKNSLTALISNANERVFEKYIVDNFGNKNCKFNMFNYLRAFEYKPNNKLLKVTSKAYESMKIKSRIAKGHGGLECSHLLTHNPDMDVISLGPKLEDEHTCVETLYLDTFKNLCAVVIKILQTIGK